MTRMIVAMGIWGNYWPQDGTEFRMVAAQAETPHNHDMPEPAEAKRYDFGDGCIFEFRIALWQEPKK